jgi:hypothetical protein
MFLTLSLTLFYFIYILYFQQIGIDPSITEIVSVYARSEGYIYYLNNGVIKVEEILSAAPHLLFIHWAFLVLASAKAAAFPPQPKQLLRLGKQLLRLGVAVPSFAGLASLPRLACLSRGKVRRDINNMARREYKIFNYLRF